MTTIIIMFVFGYAFHLCYKLFDKVIITLVDLLKSKEVKSK